MVPLSAGEYDAGAVKSVGGSVWADGDDSIDAYSGGSPVRTSRSFRDELGLQK